MPGSGDPATTRIRRVQGKVAASILSADFAYLADQVKLVEGEVDLIHVDAMDAHFVPPLSIGPVVVESLRRVTGLPLHCHLMVEHPEALFEDFAKAGADIVTCHVEAVEDPARTIELAENHGMRAGLAVIPETPANSLFPHLERLDRVIVMTLYKTGWAGQPFNETMLPKIESVRKEIDRQGLKVEVEVDGGIDERSAPRCLAAGASVLAAASSIFKAKDPGAAARRLAGIAKKG
jgi:ribulose-phosphate 3-epimerase